MQSNERGVAKASLTDTVGKRGHEIVGQRVKVGMVRVRWGGGGVPQGRSCERPPWSRVVGQVVTIRDRPPGLDVRSGSK